MLMRAPLHRHQLVYASPAAWDAVLAADWNPSARAGLSHWAAQQLPLVVTRQPPAGQPEDACLGVGVCLPERWQRQKLALRLSCSGVLHLAEFPTLTDVLAQAQRWAAQIDWRALSALETRLTAQGLVAHVYGSLGWQCVSGLDYLRAGSDIDLWIAARNATEADTAAQLLASGDGSALRLDGEIVFDNGCATPWREWRQWRAGQCRALLVKRLDGVALLDRITDMVGPAAAHQARARQQGGVADRPHAWERPDRQ